MTFYIVDVFGNTQYSGNQLAVFLNTGILAAEEMQKIASEIHFSETTFIVSRTKSKGGYDVRIFTPAKEIMLFSPEGYEAKQDLSSRVFVDYLGIPEDPATGSATGCLAAYLVQHRMFGAGLLEMTIGQGYEFGRPSGLIIRSKLNRTKFDINVGGKVIEIAEGTWK